MCYFMLLHQISKPIAYIQNYKHLNTCYLFSVIPNNVHLFVNISNPIPYMYILSWDLQDDMKQGYNRSITVHWLNNA